MLGCIKRCVEYSKVCNTRYDIMCYSVGTGWVQGVFD